MQASSTAAVLAGMFASALLSLSATASAQKTGEPAPAAATPADTPAEESKPKVEILQRGPDGRAELVRIDGYEVRVCKDGQTDSCINPRDAGLDWGNAEIDYWPGKPASEIDQTLPKSAAQPEGEPAAKQPAEAD